VSERLIDTLKLQISTTSDPQQAKEAIDILEVYGYKALPALRDIMFDCKIEEVREHCRQAIKKLGWPVE
jgi:hypothetical protein